MSHDLHIPAGADKAQIYAALLPQLEALTSVETDLIANMANIAAALHETFGWLWTGFYRVDGEQLVLGPFQGPVACVRIARGRGVCGTAWLRGETLVVPDVDAFPGHIACSSLSRSEIVVPVRDSEGHIIAVLDIDSASPATFDATDAHWLQKTVALLTPAAPARQ